MLGSEERTPKPMYRIILLFIVCATSMSFLSACSEDEVITPSNGGGGDGGDPQTQKPSTQTEPQPKTLEQRADIPEGFEKAFKLQSELIRVEVLYSNGVREDHFLKAFDEEIIIRRKEGYWEFEEFYWAEVEVAPLEPGRNPVLTQGYVNRTLALADRIRTRDRFYVNRLRYTKPEEPSELFDKEELEDVLYFEAVWNGGIKEVYALIDPFEMEILEYVYRLNTEEQPVVIADREAVQISIFLVE